MLEHGKISTRQHCLLLFCILSSALYYSMPPAVIGMVQNDVWQVLLVAFLADASLAVVFYILGLRYPNKTMVEYSEVILGKFVGKIVGVVFALFFLLASFLLLNVLTSFLVVAILPETPRWVFTVTIIATSAYILYSGLEVLSRMAELISISMIIVLTLVLFGQFNRFELINLLPVFQHSPWEIIKASFLPTSFFGFCISMGMYQPYHNLPRETLKAKWIAVSMGALLSIATCLVLLMVVGPNLTAQRSFPTLILAKTIRFGDFFERLEPLTVMFWSAGTLVAISALHYNGTLGLAQIFKLKKYQSLIPLTSLIIIGTSFIALTDDSVRMNFTRNIFPVIALPVEVGLMLILFVVSFLRHGKTSKWAKKDAVKSE